MRFGVTIPNNWGIADPRQVLAMGPLAEALDYDSVWVMDWAGTLDRLAQLDFTHIIMGHGDVVGRDWLKTFRAYVHDMVAAGRKEVPTGATLDEVKQRVAAALAPTYEKLFSAYGEYRPWRTSLAGNVERTFAMVS